LDSHQKSVQKIPGVWKSMYIRSQVSMARDGA